MSMPKVYKSRGPPFFKLQFFGGRRRLINNGMLINPDLTLQETSSAELLGGEGADFLRWVAFWSIRSSGLLRWFCVTGAALRMTWHHFFLAGAVLRQVDCKNRKTHWHEAVSSARNFPFLKEVSQNCFVFDVVKFKNWRSLAELLRFGCCQVQKMKKSRRIASFLMLCQLRKMRKSRWIASFLTLSRANIEEVSENCFVFDVVNFEKWGSLAELLRFWCFQFWKMKKSRRIARFSSLQIDR